MFRRLLSGLPTGREPPFKSRLLAFTKKDGFVVSVLVRISDRDLVAVLSLKFVAVHHAHGSFDRDFIAKLKGLRRAPGSVDRYDVMMAVSVSDLPGNRLQWRRTQVLHRNRFAVFIHSEVVDDGRIALLLEVRAAGCLGFQRPCRIRNADRVLPPPAERPGSRHWS